MAKLTFYPIGNADCILTEFADGRLMLLDYCHRKDCNDKDDERIDLAEELCSVLASHDRDDFDVVAFTHADDDHVGASEDFFWFDHAKEYQGKGRVKMQELWVPACLVLQSGIGGSARVIRQEARYRLKRGAAIRVFGNPGVLDKWLKSEGINPEDRAHLITHAGECVPGYTRASGRAEIFVHSPFSFRMEEEETDRNNASVVLHVTFFEGEPPSRAMLGGDAEHGAWGDIVYKTEQKGREERLLWDTFKVSHHCSYTALAPEKGKKKTKPTEPIARLFDRGQEDCLIVATSYPIPHTTTKDPPHKQAAAYYRGVASDKKGDFLVTMKEPTEDTPQPLVIRITAHGVAHDKGVTPAVVGSSVVSRKTPRLGGRLE